MAGAEIRLEEVSKRYGDVAALDGVDVVIEGGRITTLLGPSGCGKTTTLKIIAGLEKPTSGRVFFDGEDYTDVPVNKRGIGMVFQDLALFPHMTVYGNVAFGLEVRRLPRHVIEDKVRWALELVELDPDVYADRRVSELSGGQQQRVALARALVVEPRVLLLDEPLAHLDYKLRRNLLQALRGIQRKLGITMVYVTHDQTEAMFLSHKVVVMRDGRVVQEGDPVEVYENPRDSFVASFFGNANILPARMLGISDAGALAMIRYEKIRINPHPGDVDIVYDAIIEDAYFQGPLLRLDLRVNGERLGAYVPRTNGWMPKPGSKVTVGWSLNDVRVLES